MRLSILLFLLSRLLVQSPAFAQSSPSGSFEGNLGTWKWEKQQPPSSQEEETIDEAAEQGRGETSWERLNSERNAEFEAPASQEGMQSLTPLEMWRLLRGAWRKDG